MEREEKSRDLILFELAGGRIIRCASALPEVRRAWMAAVLRTLLLAR